MLRKRFILLLAAAGLALTSALAGGPAAASAASAATHTTGHAARATREAGRGVALGPDVPGPNVEVCTENSSGYPTQCINDWNGNLAINARAARFYQYLSNSPGNNLMYFEFVHYISGCGTSGGFQPFADGSGLNCRYNGRPVYALQWMRESSGYNYDTGVCIAGDAPYAVPYNENCNSGSSTLYYAWSSYDALISVGASNYLYEAGGGPNQPVWLGSNGEGNIGNGQNVYLTPVQNDNLAWQPYTYGG